MNETDFTSVNNAEFEAMLSEAIPDKAPDEIVNEVTPWKKAMKRILFGISLNALTLNIIGLEYILPTIGTILCILGLRVLRKENKWFTSCYAVTIVNAVYKFAILILNTIPYSFSQAFFYIATPLLVFLELIFFICALAQTQKKAGLAPKKAASIAVILWYALLLFLGIIQFTGYILPYAMMIGFILIMVSFNKIAKETQAAGYTVNATPVRVSDGVLTASIAVLLCTGIVCGYIFNSGYDMQWQVLQESESPQVAEIKAHLIDLGFPKYVLDDMSDEDILACEGAEKVIFHIDESPVNEGRKVTTQIGNTIHTKTVYDVKELRTTGVAVKFGTKPETVRIIHHFLWTVNPGFYGTESIQLWTAAEKDGWSENGEFTGRVLYTKDGVDYASPFNSLGRETYTSNDIFFGKRTSTYPFATFSLPDKGEKQRGYVSYPIIEAVSDYIIDSWFNYTHQTTWLQYPAKTAKESRMSSGYNDVWAFRTIQDTLQISWDDELFNGSSEETLRIYEELKSKGELN